MSYFKLERKRQQQPKRCSILHVKTIIQIFLAETNVLLPIIVVGKGK